MLLRVSSGKMKEWGKGGRESVVFFSSQRADLVYPHCDQFPRDEMQSLPGNFDPLAGDFFGFRPLGFCIVHIHPSFSLSLVARRRGRLAHRRSIRGLINFLRSTDGGNISILNIA